jgi:hypothetical protein
MTAQPRSVLNTTTHDLGGFEEVWVGVGVEVTGCMQWSSHLCSTLSTRMRKGRQIFTSTSTHRMFQPMCNMWLFAAGQAAARRSRQDRRH